MVHLLPIDLCLAAIVLFPLFSSVAAVPQDNTFEIVGNSGVSAQQLFLGKQNKVYIVDKTENNPVSVNGHPAWATEYDIDTNEFRVMDIRTNSFCAGGNVLGNGTWLNVGGNQRIKKNGETIMEGDVNIYGNESGGKALRSLDPCTDGTCAWTDDGSNYMTTQRWYPTLETLEDGSIIIIGGDLWGGFVNSEGNNNPTYEFYPSLGGPIGLNILVTTLPANLYPLTWLLPSGNLFIQTGPGTEIFDYKKNIEYPLPDMPHAIRTYPGSAANAMMPLTPANNWTATIMFCGGSDLPSERWVDNWNLPAHPADSTCVSMTPDMSTNWIEEEALPEARGMGNWIYLPDGRLVLLNGVGSGVAGYGPKSFAIGQSYGDNPIYSAHYFDYNQPKGSRFSPPVAYSTIARMYHSAATLLPDGSIFSSGSNPNADYIAAGTPNYPYPTEYRVERFYPDYFTAARPTIEILPDVLTYGGNYFDVKISAHDLGSLSNLDNTKVTIIRTGFSTHAINMGQRYLQLDSRWTIYTDNSAVLHVSQLPPNPAILAPGPALLFVVVNGIPSHGHWIMCGSGQLGPQPILPVQPLPDNIGETGGKQNKGDEIVTQIVTEGAPTPTRPAPQPPTETPRKKVSAAGTSKLGWVREAVFVALSVVAGSMMIIL